MMIDNVTILLNGMVLGIFLLLLSRGFVNLVSTRYAYYFWYSGFILFIFIYYIWGVNLGLLWASDNINNSVLIHISICLCILFFLHFVYNYLPRKRYHSLPLYLYIISNILFVANIALVILFPHKSLLLLFSLAAIFISSFTFILHETLNAIYTLRINNKKYSYLLWLLASYGFFFLLFVFTLYASVSHNFIIQNNIGFLVFLLLTGQFLLYVSLTQKQQMAYEDLIYMRQNFSQDLLQQQDHFRHNISLEIDKLLTRKLGHFNKMLEPARAKEFIIDGMGLCTGSEAEGKDYLLTPEINTLNQLSSIANEVLLETSQLTEELYPHKLDTLGLEATLVDLFRQISLISNFTIQYKIVSLPTGLDIQTRVHLYRIIQETIQNSIKHACATILEVVMRPQGDSYLISMHDNGQGTTCAKKTGGLGFETMRWRTDIMGGSLKVSLGKTGGFCVDVCIPLK